MSNETLTTILAIFSVLWLESLAILKGIDRYYFGLAVATIAGLGGYKLKSLLTK